MLSPLILCGKVVAIAKEIRVESAGPEHIVRSAKNMSNITWEDLLFITILFATAWWRLLLFWCRTFQLERSKPQQNDQWLQGGFSLAHTFRYLGCVEMKKLAFTFLYTVEVLFAPPGRNKRRQPYFATATVPTATLATLKWWTWKRTGWCAVPHLPA